MLLDTYAWIEFFNGTSKGENVKELIGKTECFTSAISIAELSEWIEREGLERQKIMGYVKGLSTILALENDSLELAGIIKIEKRKNVKGISLIDSIIIATARQYKLQIITGDAHFKGENVLML